MGDLGGTSENEQPSSGALNRRNMLKAAVAAGAGAAAWTAPDIKTLGFKPALAQAGSPVIDTTVDDFRSLNANCGAGAPCNGDPEWGNNGNPGIIRVSVLSNNDTIVTVHQVGNLSQSACAFQPAEATVTTQPPGYSCVITSMFLNCGDGSLDEEPIAVPAITVGVPACDVNTGCDYRIGATLQCTPV